MGAKNRSKVQELKDYTNELLSAYYQENDNYLRSEYLIRVANAANYYMDLTETDLTDKEFKAELTQCFKNINYLFEKEIILFGDVQLLLDTTTVYRLARELASKMYGRDLVTMSVSITLLNAVFVLIKRKATDEARKVLNATCQLNFSTNDLLTVTRIKFLKTLLNYIDSGKEYQIMQFLNSLENKQLKESWTFAFQQIKDIYNLSNM
ncbi:MULTISPECIES: hypothetical protein [Lactobacillus]|uniref:Rgg family transcriptional regulator n=1 Tax=Lactobacillus TaxID=1578 RepID=UPI0031E5D8F7